MIDISTRIVDDSFMDIMLLVATFYIRDRGNWASNNFPTPDVVVVDRRLLS